METLGAAALLIAILAPALVAAYVRAREQRLPVPLVGLIARRGLSIEQAEQACAAQPVALALAHCALCAQRRLCRSRAAEPHDCPNRAFLAHLGGKGLN